MTRFTMPSLAAMIMSGQCGKAGNFVGKTHQFTILKPRAGHVPAFYMASIKTTASPPLIIAPRVIVRESTCSSSK
jgi:hypothetical protein